jgi:nucleotide-binding universal stress UspA family protein
MDGPTGRPRRPPKPGQQAPNPGQQAPNPGQQAPNPGQQAPNPGRGQLHAAAVVVGLDGSDTSWDAFWWACGEARRLGGRAVAVFVSPAGGGGMAAIAVTAGVCDYSAVHASAAAQASSLRDQVRRHLGDDGPDITFVHTSGDPARELLRVAEAVRADMIVVGRSTKARHHLAGSLGRYLIARRKAPFVVVVP